MSSAAKSLIHCAHVKNEYYESFIAEFYFTIHLWHINDNSNMGRICCCVWSVYCLYSISSILLYSVMVDTVSGWREKKKNGKHDTLFQLSSQTLSVFLPMRSPWNGVNYTQSAKDSAKQHKGYWNRSTNLCSLSKYQFACEYSLLFLCAVRALCWSLRSSIQHIFVSFILVPVVCAFVSVAIWKKKEKQSTATVNNSNESL